MNCTNCNRWDVMLVNGRCSICNGGKAPSLLPAPELKKQGNDKPAKRAKQPRKQSSLEASFEALLKLSALMGYEKEYRFSDERKFRLDFAWVGARLGVELEGGIFSGGRHGRGAGIQGDIEKANHALLKGWRVLRYSAVDLRDRPLQVMDEVKAALGLPF